MVCLSMEGLGVDNCFFDFGVEGSNVSRVDDTGLGSM